MCLVCEDIAIVDDGVNERGDRADGGEHHADQSQHRVQGVSRRAEEGAKLVKEVERNRAERELVKQLDEMLAEVAEELKSHRESGYCFADDMQGALAKREEILATQQYNLELMKKSILTGQRIPSDRKIQEKGEWW